MKPWIPRLHAKQIEMFNSKRPFVLFNGGRAFSFAARFFHYMKKTHVIHDQFTGKYFREENPGQHLPSAPTERQADFYTPEEAQTITLEYYQPGAQFEVREGSASAYMAFLGRRGGRVNSPAKAKANRRRARRPRPNRQPSAAT